MVFPYSGDWDRNRWRAPGVGPGAPAAGPTAGWGQVAVRGGTIAGAVRRSQRTWSAGAGAFRSGNSREQTHPARPFVYNGRREVNPDRPDPVCQRAWGPEGGARG